MKYRARVTGTVKNPDGTAYAVVALELEDGRRAEALVKLEELETKWKDTVKALLEKAKSVPPVQKPKEEEGEA